MTLAQAISRTLRRAGLTLTETEEQDRARECLSMILAEVMPATKWWWLDRTTTFNTVASTRTYQPISGNVTNWWSFVDETNDNPLEIVGPDKYDLLDLDRGDEGTVEAVYIEGLDATTGYPVVGLWRTPSAVATIRIRYQTDISEWTSSSDSSQLLTLGVPRLIENILIYGAAGMILDEEGDESQALMESRKKDIAMNLAMRQNLAMQGNRMYIPRGSSEDELLINVGTDTVSAA